MKTNTKGGADAQLGEWMRRHLRPERATMSFQMRHSHRHDVAVITELCIRNKNYSGFKFHYKFSQFQYIASSKARKLFKTSLNDFDSILQT
jgi:hypothetical protein